MISISKFGKETQLTLGQEQQQQQKTQWMRGKVHKHAREQLKAF